MRSVARALRLLCLALAPFPLSAQEGDAFVLPPGMVRLRGAAELSRFDALFADGGTEQLGAGLLGPVNSLSFAPLLPLQEELARFLSEAGSPLPADAQSFQLGTLDVAAAASTRVVPLSLAAGVLPRLEVGIELPLLRDQILFTRRGLSGGTLGPNPDPAANAERFALFGDEWSSIGGSAFLPTSGSPLGVELQRLFEAGFPGEALDLPDSAATVDDLNDLLAEELGLAPLEGRTSAWRVGDARVSARFSVASTLGAVPVPTDSAGIHYRAAVSVSARLPTGSEPDSVWLLAHGSEARGSGFGVGADGDVFVGRRLWATASLQYSRRSEVEVVRRVASPAAPLSAPGRPRSVRWTPADRLSLRVAPRFRLTDAISIGVQYSLARLGDSSFELASGEGDASVLNAPGGIAQSAGFGFRYSTLPAYWGGAGLLPVEVVLRYDATLDAPTGTPHASRVFIQANVFHQLIGKREEGTELRGAATSRE